MPAEGARTFSLSCISWSLNFRRCCDPTPPKNLKCFIVGFFLAGTHARTKEKMRSLCVEYWGIEKNNSLSYASKSVAVSRMKQYHTIRQLDGHGVAALNAKLKVRSSKSVLASFRHELTVKARLYCYYRPQEWTHCFQHMAVFATYILSRWGYRAWNLLPSLN